MELLWAIIVWTFFGFIAGGLARFLVPGRQPMGWLATIALGVVGSFVGGFIGFVFTGGEMVRASGFIMSVIGAVIALCIYLYAGRNKAAV